MSIIKGIFYIILIAISGSYVLAQSGSEFAALDIYGNKSSPLYYTVDLSHAPRQHIESTYPDNSSIPELPEFFNSFARDAINLRQGEYIKFVFYPNAEQVCADKIYLLINALDAYKNTVDNVFGYVRIDFVDNSSPYNCELKIGDNIASWWTGIPESNLALVFNDSMNIWNYDENNQKWGVGLLELNIPPKVIKNVWIESANLKITPPGAVAKVYAGLRFMGISLHISETIKIADFVAEDDEEKPVSNINRTIKITGVIVENAGESSKLYSGSFKGIIKAGDFSNGPWMPKIQCRAVRVDDPAKTSSTIFRWRLESRLKNYGIPGTIWIPADADSGNNDIWRTGGYVFHESDDVRKVNDHDENIWIVNWKRLFAGGLITLIVEADVDGDGIIREFERDETWGEIIAESPRRSDVMRMFDAMNDNPPGILAAIADHESGGINQFVDGHPVINRNFDSADCGFMQINTLYWPECLTGPKYQGLWNWKDNIRAGKYIFEHFESETYKKLSLIIYDLLTQSHFYDSVPYKLDISDIEGFYYDFLFSEKYVLSVLTRYNGTWHLKDHPEKDEYYQPGRDFQNHIVYYGEYYHPEITGDDIQGWKVKWEPNDYHYDEYVLQGMRYADEVYYNHYCK